MLFGHNNFDLSWASLNELSTTFFLGLASILRINPCAHYDFKIPWSTLIRCVLFQLKRPVIGQCFIKILLVEAINDPRSFLRKHMWLLCSFLVDIKHYIWVSFFNGCLGVNIIICLNKVITFDKLCDSSHSPGIILLILHYNSHYIRATYVYTMNTIQFRLHNICFTNSFILHLI